MSGIKNLIEILTNSYGMKNPVRNYYYRLFYQMISSKLCKRGVQSFKDIRLVSTDNFRYVQNEEKESIIALANKTLNNIFNYLGSGDCVLKPINWSKDFISGFEWPAGTYYKKYKQVDLTNNADVKVPRELSRSHFLLHLALAYQFTNNGKYAEKVIALITDWIDKNPLLYSINWGCSMDVAIRAINWIWALSIIKRYNINTTDSNKIKNSLYQHGWFIYHNLEGNFFSYNHNHYFSDIVGLLHIAVLFPRDKTANRWLLFSINTFYKEVRLQVLPSGMSFEGSTYYNRLILELILPTIVVLQRNGVDVPPDILGRLESMFDFVMKITMPNGEVPIIGDQDNGRGLPFGIEPLNDERYLLSVGALMYGRGDLKCAGNGYNIYCAVFGDKDSKNQYEKIEEADLPLKSVFLRDTGFAIMRRGGNYLIFNADNQGMYRDTGTSVSHTHCDWFSFVLCARGVPIIVDPGSYVYSSNAEVRNRFRSTKMHNTLVVDGENQEKMNEKLLWNYKRKSSPKILDWSSSAKADYISCIHNGYDWLGGHTTHIRSVQHDKVAEQWIIIDKLESDTIHKMALYFHLDKDVESFVNNNQVHLMKNGVELVMEFISSDIETIMIEPSNISRGYGEIVKSDIVIVSLTSLNKTCIKTLIWVK